MSIRLEDFFSEFGNGRGDPPIESFIRGNFELVLHSIDSKWVLVRHIPMREDRWLYAIQLRVKDIRTCYYDADPTFLPECER